MLFAVEEALGTELLVFNVIVSVTVDVGKFVECLATGNQKSLKNILKKCIRFIHNYHSQWSDGCVGMIAIYAISWFKPQFAQEDIKPKLAQNCCTKGCVSSLLILINKPFYDVGNSLISTVYSHTVKHSCIVFYITNHITE